MEIQLQSTQDYEKCNVIILNEKPYQLLRKVNSKKLLVMDSYNYKHNVGMIKH